MGKLCHASSVVSSVHQSGFIGDVAKFTKVLADLLNDDFVWQHPFE